MKKINNITIGGIQQKIFNLVLIMILLVMTVYSVVIIYQGNHLNQLVNETNEKQKQSITAITTQTMDGVIAASLCRSTQMEARIADDMFEDLAHVVRMVSDYAEKLFETPENYAVYPTALPDPSGDGEISVQLLTADGVDLDDPVIAEKLGLLGNISPLLTALYANSSVNSCYIALPDGVMLLADDHPSTKFEEDGSLITFPMQDRDWYKGAVRTGGLFFTDVVADVFTGQIGIMCAVPVYHNGELAAVAGADLFLDKMAEAVSGAGSQSSFTVIVNQNGHVIFSPQTEGVFRVELAANSQDLRKSENAELAALVSEALRSPTEITLIETDGNSYYLTGAPIQTIGWAVLSAVSKEATDQPALMMEQQYNDIFAEARTGFSKNLSAAMRMITILLIAATILALAGALTVSKRIVKPLEAMTVRVQSLGGEDLQFRMEKTYQTGDEIEILAESFAMLSAKTLQYVDQVKKVTAEKERIGAELSMATDIQASQLPKLFPAFPNRQEFDIFASMTPAKEVGGDFYDFFLVDEDHIALIMADVSGKGVPAALFMMISRVLIKSHLQNGETPGEALANVNDQLCENNDAQLFVTVWAAVLQISTGKGIAANAGHEHPAFCKKNGQYELITYRHSPAVAAIEGIPFREHTFEMDPGDSLFVYTDGVTEATNNEKELFGNERLLNALNKKQNSDPKQTLQNVREDIDSFVAGAEQFDDITMLCFKYNGRSQ